MADASTTPIPTVDIGPLLRSTSSPTTHQETAARDILRACETHGIFFVTGHGITARQKHVALNNARRFFSLSEHAKRKLVAKKGGFARGYIKIGGESGSHRLEFKEGFSYGYPWPVDSPPQNVLQGPNVWPEDKDVGANWRGDMLNLFSAMISVSEALSRGLALALGPQQGRDLDTCCRGGETISIMRLFHYLPYDEEDGMKNKCPAHYEPQRGETTVGNERPTTGLPDKQRKKTWSSPHTDWGFSTCILQDGVGGLQFFNEETQRWMDVPCSSPDSLVMNCGDYLSLLTGGRLKSPVHQVVSPGGQERTSFVFFHYPSFDTTLPTGAVSAKITTSEIHGDPEGHKSTKRQTRGGQGLSYNTLLDLHLGEGGHNTGDAHSDKTKLHGTESFGDYLERKWSAVFDDQATEDVPA